MIWFDARSSEAGCNQIRQQTLAEHVSQSHQCNLNYSAHQDYDHSKEFCETKQTL